MHQPAVSHIDPAEAAGRRITYITDVVCVCLAPPEGVALIVNAPVPGAGYAGRNID